MTIPAIAVVDTMMRIESEDQEIMTIENQDIGGMMRMTRIEREEGGITVKTDMMIEDVDVIVMIEDTVYDDKPINYYMSWIHIEMCYCMHIRS